jgi:hypothetical protein
MAVLPVQHKQRIMGEFSSPGDPAQDGRMTTFSPDTSLSFLEQHREAAEGVKRV